MIQKNEFPLSLGGFAWQENYKNFDIVVHVLKHQGISAYAFSPEKRIIWQESRTYGNKDEFLQWARDAIDRHLANQSKQAEESALKRADYYLRKGKSAAIAAFSSAMYFSNIKDEAYKDALEYFRYELDKQFANLPR